MTVEYKVPFFSNTKDGIHCYQAAIRMVIKYFEPANEFSWKELDLVSGKAEGLWTWPMAGFLWMRERGYELRDVELFDYERLSLEGGDYLIDEFGVDVGKVQIAHSDMRQAKGLAAEFISKVKVNKREPGLSELEGYLDKGYLVICNVNLRALNHVEGFSGHFVVIIGYDEENLKIHDPGLPPREGRVVIRSVFEHAWAYPNHKAKNFVAIKLRER